MLQVAPSWLYAYLYSAEIPSSGYVTRAEDPQTPGSPNSAVSSKKEKTELRRLVGVAKLVLANLLRHIHKLNCKKLSADKIFSPSSHSQDIDMRVRILWLVSRDGT